MGVFTGTVPQFVAFARGRAPSFQTLADIATAETAAWTVWTPTLTSLTLGSGTVTARYRQVGKTVDYRFKFTLGAGSAVASGPRFTLPVQQAAYLAATIDPFGRGTLGDASTNSYACEVRISSGTTVEIVGIGTAGIHTAVTSTVPFTWGTGDTISVAGSYEAA